MCTVDLGLIPGAKHGCAVLVGRLSNKLPVLGGGKEEQTVSLCHVTWNLLITISQVKPPIDKC